MAVFSVFVSTVMDVHVLCVYMREREGPVILWMSWKFITQVFTVSPSQKL